MRMNSVFIVIIAAIFSVFFFSACGDDGGSSSSDGTGTFKLFLTDKPASGEIEAVTIEFEKVMINKDDDADNEGDGSWILLNGTPGKIDLLELNNGKLQEIGVVDLDVGTYNQIRIFVKSATVTINGKEELLKLSSEKIKLVSSFTISDGIETVLIADFNAYKSIKKTGQGYLMTPVIRLIEQKVSGAIEGVVSEPVDRTVSVSAFNAGETADAVAGTVADDNGKFIVGYLNPGKYDLLIEADGFVSEKIEGIEVVAGEKFVLPEEIKLVAVSESDG